jgi:peptidoglycan-associated lipoprotein
MRNKSYLWPVAAVLLIIAGCGSDPAKTPKAAAARDGSEGAAPAHAAQASAAKGDTSSPTASSVHIDDRILKACGNIPKAHFTFDSASIQPDAASSLDALARCFSSGPLAGKGMRLVGHADARGETEYNFGLGHKRASSVASFLGKKGVEKSRLEATSKGELDASGTDEDGWARDRRVDVFLAE